MTLQANTFPRHLKVFELNTLDYGANTELELKLPARARCNEKSPHQFFPDNRCKTIDKLGAVVQMVSSDIEAGQLGDLHEISEGSRHGKTAGIIVQLRKFRRPRL